jgi:formylglycine-generating enzyme required for sulfatase activity
MPKVKVLDQLTNEEYRLFKPEHKFPSGHEKKPVTYVTFGEGMEYARWLSETTGRKFRLVTEEERKAAEATFEADFSQHPLKEVPDVGTFGKNAEGVTGLLGVTYDWCAESGDIQDPVALGWGRPKSEPTTLDGMRKLRGELDAKIQAAEAALKVLADLGIKP